MKKVFFSTLMVISMLFLTTNVTFAKDQLPNADVFLGNYVVVKGFPETSDYCTATQSHINIVVAPKVNSVDAIMQYRAPNQGWKDVGSTWTHISSAHTFNMNAVKGNDYRVMIRASRLGAEGQVTCW